MGYIVWYTMICKKLYYALLCLVLWMFFASWNENSSPSTEATSLPYCDTSLPVEKRALVKHLRFHLVRYPRTETNRYSTSKWWFPIQIIIFQGGLFSGANSPPWLQALMTWCLDSALKRKSSRSHRMLLLEVWSHLQKNMCLSLLWDENG